MGILGNIISAIKNLFEGPLSQDQMAVVLDKKVADSGERLDWRNSIVDLMKAAGMDSSLQARTSLATELGFSGKFTGTAQQNEWLHQQVMNKLSQTMR